MAGFIIRVSSNNRGWYLAGTILGVLVSLGVCIAGFATRTPAVGIVGLVMVLGAVLLMVDAIANLRG